MRLKAAFKKAVCEYLQENAGLDQGAVAIVGKPGKPRPDCGPWFYGVWGAGRTWQMKTCLDAVVSVNVTVTKRLEQPMDRLDDALDAETDGLDEAVGRLITLLWAGQNDIRARTAQLLADESDGTSEAPRVLSDSEPDYCGPDWFGAVAEGGSAAGQLYGRQTAGQVCGLQATVQFGGLRVTHPWDTATL